MKVNIRQKLTCYVGTELCTLQGNISQIHQLHKKKEVEN